LDKTKKPDNIRMHGTTVGGGAFKTRELSRYTTPDAELFPSIKPHTLH